MPHGEFSVERRDAYLEDPVARRLDGARTAVIIQKGEGRAAAGRFGKLGDVFPILLERMAYVVAVGNHTL